MVYRGVYTLLLLYTQQVVIDINQQFTYYFWNWNTFDLGRWIVEATGSATESGKKN